MKGPDRDLRCFHRVFVERRKSAVYEYRRPWRQQISRRSERDGVVGAGGGTIDPVALGAVEWKLLTIEREEILPEELTERCEEGAKAADDRIIAPDRVLRLADIRNEHDRNHEGENANGHNEQRSDETEAIHDEMTK